jgi:hypothetical protein
MTVNNLTQYHNDSTTTFFNNIYVGEFTVSPDVNSAILGFFEQLTDNKVTAKALANSIIFTSKTQNMDPMEVLSKFMNMPKGKIFSYLTMFLNMNRVGTSMLGISNSPITSKYIKRAILP